MKLWQVTLVLLLLFALISGCAQPTPTPTPAPPKPAPAPSPSPSAAPTPTPASTPKWDEDLAIGTKTTPSTTYVMGAATSQAINKFSKKFTGRVSPAGSESVFPDSFVKGDLDLGVMESVTAYWAANGIKGWKTPMPVRMLAFGPPSHFPIVANPKSGIKTPADLKGKRWMGYRTGSDLLKDVNEAFQYAYGLSETNTTILAYSSAKEFSDALKEGRVNGHHQSRLLRHPLAGGALSAGQSGAGGAGDPAGRPGL
ncbi:MAG: TAXI family TRAP transporter solute-binding subunit [Chloroflexota bacterium]